MTAASNKPIRKRTRAREVALQYLFQWDLLKSRRLQPTQLAESFCRSQDGDDEVVDFAVALIAGVIAHADDLDAAIEATAQNWSLARMLTVDRTILRMGAYELMFAPEIPPRVAINEAIELAKKFSTERSSGFVNGILDRIAHQGASSASASSPSTDSP